MNRPEELKEAMLCFEIFANMPSYWKIVKDYIKELEDFKKATLETQNRNTDDGK